MMEPILEADSFLEHSVIAQSLLIQGGSRSQSATKSLRKSVMSTRFVFSETSKNFEIEVDEDDQDVLDQKSRFLHELGNASMNSDYFVGVESEGNIDDE